jgi:hypothetical protein
MSETLEGVMSALSPALVHKKVPTNYRTAEGSKKFTHENLQLYLDEPRDRAFIYDWHNIL